MNRIQWQSIVDQFNHSGLSISAFAKQHDLVYHQLLYRIHKYREQARDLPKPDFIPVTLNNDPVKSSPEKPLEALGVCQFANGARLEIYNPELLHHLSPLLEA